MLPKKKRVVPLGEPKKGRFLVRTVVGNPHHLLYRICGHPAPLSWPVHMEIDEVNIDFIDLLNKTDAWASPAVPKPGFSVTDQFDFDELVEVELEGEFQYPPGVGWDWVGPVLILRSQAAKILRGEGKPPFPWIMVAGRTQGCIKRLWVEASEEASS